MTSIHLRQPVRAAPGDRSFWLQDIAAGPATEPLRGEQSTEVAIVGGGYTGLWTALRIKEQAPDTRVTILEADFCGSGASGRNGGQVHTWFAEIDQLASVVGMEEARRLCTDTAEAIDELEALQNAGTIDMGLRLDGWFWTASSIAQEGAWEQAFRTNSDLGEDRFRRVDGREILDRTGSSVSYTGIIEARAGTVQPARLATGLRALALARGIAICEQSPVQAIHPGNPCRLQTADGVLTAPKVVLAANAWLAGIPELRQYLYVVSSQVIATAPVPELLDRIGWTDGASICDAQSHVLYYQRTPEGRVIFGRGSGEIAYADHFGASFNRSPDRGIDNRRELNRVYPALRGVGIDHDWSGPIDCTAEHVPVFDHLRDHPNIFYGMGFNGTGIAQTPVAGRILASLVLGRQDRWSQSGLVGLARRTKLPPEPVRYLGARLVRKAIRRKNDLEIRNLRADWLTSFLAGLVPGHRSE